MAQIGVYLLDGHEIVRRGLKDLLSAEGDIAVVGESGSVSCGLRDIVTLRPRVAVVDVLLPDGSGIDVCRALRTRAPEVRTLVLTCRDDDDALFAAIMAGAAGYVLTRVSGAEVVAAVRGVAAGRSLVDPGLTTKVLERVRRRTASCLELRSLSAQEHKVLAHVAEGETNRQIALAMGLSDKTVKNYVSSILAKLGLTSRTQAAVLASRGQSA